jgi:ribonuclease HI
MLITINTDASCSEAYGGYAFWIVCDAGKIQKAGKIKAEIKGSQQAEMMCIANALHTLKHSKFKSISKVIINTDSTPCIQALTGFKSSWEGAKECLFTMMEICIANGKSIREVSEMFEFRHVKAHTGKKDKRSFVNEWCDKEAKKYCKLRMQEG